MQLLNFTQNSTNNLMQPKHSMFYLLLMILIWSGTKLKAQDLSFNNSVPSEITVCDNAESFQIEFTNISGATLSNPSIQIDFPTGINFVSGSIIESSSYNVQEGNISNLELITLTTNSIPNGATVSFAFDALARFDAIAMQQAGGLFRNNIIVNYTGGSDTEETAAYNILVSALSVSNVSPISNTVFVGQEFTRDVTIVNGGYGRISSFVLEDTHDANLDWLSADKGSFIVTGQSLQLTGADFTSIGNGDAYFDQNEQIIVRQTIQAAGCNNVESDIVAIWSCDSQELVSNHKLPYTTISLYPPNLAITPTAPFNTCVDGTSPNRQELLITNNGTGPANETEVVVFQEPNNIYSRVDVGSITAKYGANSAVSITADASTDAAAYACLGTNPKSGFTITLDPIQPGESVIVSWDSYTCRTEVCTGVGLLGWEYTANYTDMCYGQTYDREGIGQEESEKIFSIFAENPSDLIDGQTGEYTFILSSATFSLPEGVNPYFEVVFDIPLGLNWSGTSTDLVLIDGVTEWAADYLDYNAGTRTLIARYNFPVPINLLRSEFRLNLTADCSSGVSGWVTTGMQLFYIMDSSCPDPYKMPLTCYETPDTYIHCPGSCEHGLVFNSFEFERQSLGTPDNDLDGLPDASGSFNLNKVKLNRVMVSDTFRTTFNGTIKTSATFPDWAYGYAKSVYPYGDKIAVLSAKVTIQDQSTGATLVCNNVPFTETLNGFYKTVDLDFSPATLNGLGCTDFNGFVLESDDIIDLEVDFHVVGNIGGKIEQLTIANDFYVSNTANGTPYQCNVWNGNFTLIGYYFTNAYSDIITVDECTKTIAQNFYMSIGDCCTNYAGGDFFPYEYRNWAHVKDLRVEIPEGYSVVSMSMRQVRTRYTNATITENVSSISPVSITGQTYIFDLEQYYIPYGGTLNLSDDGFHGTVFVEVEPNCMVNEAASLPMEWYYTYRKADFIGGGITGEYGPAADYLKYKRANIQITTNLQSVDGISPTASWDVKIKNANEVEAPNSWFYISNQSGNITILEVEDLGTNTLLTPNNGFYTIGTVAGNTENNYRITVSYNSCGNDNIVVETGYGCEGVPTNIASFNCPIKEIPLYLYPKPSELQVRIRDTPPVDDCATTVQVEVELLSSKLAAVEDILIDMTIPDITSISFESGSGEVLYPASGSYTAVSDPSLSGSKYTMTAASLDATVGTDGLVGVTDVTANKLLYRFNITLGPNFKVGDYIEFEFNGKRVCGDPINSLNLAYDPSGRFDTPTNIGLSDTGNNWSASWGDYDGDGFVDLFVTTYDLDEPNWLYKNDGDGSFTRITTAPFGTDLASSLASSWGDYDNDGDLDLFVANNIGSKNFLYRNNGNGSFTKITNDPIVNDDGYAHSASWVDYNKDGFLDMFVTDYFSTRFNLLYKNNGDGTFTKITDVAITLDPSSAVNAAWSDYNNDGYPDVFISNTNDEDNRLYLNLGNGDFEQITNGDIVNDGGKSTGASWADIDNDLDMDLFVANAGNQDNFLYTNNGDGTFTKVTTGVIVNDQGNSHGSAWTDYDNDGDIDLFVSNNENGNNFLYVNDGTGTFKSIENTITTDGGDSFGAAWADIDNDGDADLFVGNNTNQDNFIYLNGRGRCQAKSCIVLTGNASNKSAIGAKVFLKANIYGTDTWQMREWTAQTGGGTGGQNELKALFGLGDASQVDSIIVEWPSGLTQVLVNQPVDDCLAILEESSSTICGTVYYDANGNCTQDANEVGMAGVGLRLMPGDIVVYTNENGEYEFEMGIGTYTISQLTSSDYAQICPTSNASHTVNVNAVNSSFCANDFANSSTCILPNLSVSVAPTAHRIGFENLVAITYRNRGVVDASEVTLTITLDGNIVANESTVLWDDYQNNVITYLIGAVPAGSSSTFYLIDSVLASVVVDTEITISANIDGLEDDCDLSDNSMVSLSRSVGAFDPNDMLVSPEGYIDAGTILTYKIRFQNVGNAAVDQVRVESELPEGLDMNSLELGAVSHPYKFSLREDRKMVWDFEFITLPDSASSMAESQGFIIFKVKSDTDLPDQFKIENNADIYFDFNDPIRTNTVVNIIGEAPNGRPNVSGTLNVFPNPMFSSTTLEIYNENNSREVIREIKVIDNLGRLVKLKKGLDQDQVQLKREELIPGYYFLKITGANNKIYTAKLLIK